MRRFFWHDLEGEVSIGGAEAKHIARVLRMQEGDGLILFDGSGFDYYGKIEMIGEDFVRVKIVEKKYSDAELPGNLTIYQAVIKNDHLDYAVQKCTELGASEIVPFLSERCVKRPDEKSAQRLVERQRRIALEASKQCGRSRIPKVTGVIGLQDVAGEIEAGKDLALFAYENEEKITIRDILTRGQNMENISVIVGPEGGFTSDEAVLLMQSGAQSCSLGNLILRSETAGPAACAMIQYHFMGEEK
ncbi:MAG: 16S rRNA (uracil(1498)-N(3))-methyltransferase [Christensenella sp.]|nr:16S rRNA (uracil(1498)-N(3))-methyltransferase [Christensenella sp.]